jgi:uncharacterized protein YgiM (DUF1202 family)
VERRSKRILGLLVLAAVVLVASSVHAATLNKRARLREGPTKESTLLGWVEDGTSVEIDGERNGWYAVKTPDGRAGYLWQEHLRFDAGEPARSETAPPTPPTMVAAIVTTSLPAPPPTPDTRPSVPPSERTETNVAGELERLRTELARLATAQQEMAQHAHGGRTDPPSAPIGSDGSAGAAVLFFGIGALVGWLFGRFAPSRRERRSRRLRI